MDKYENFIQTVNWSVREEPAVKIFSVDLSQEIVDEVNEYIDNNTIPNNINYAANLAGQLKENEKSAQLDFDCSSGVGLQLKDLLDTMATAYLQKAYSRISKAMVSDLWTNHAYAGDYNPIHDHGVKTEAGLSGILWLKVPSCIKSVSGDDDAKQGLTNASGLCDGWTQLIWGTTTRKDVLQLRPVTESYEQPVAGRLIIFPNWLKHQVFPFFGEGERRSLAVNWNIFDTKKEIEDHLNGENQ
tara:strand:+ start:58 stop:786 length:729 start_codon:yes stop_codon:yes gene_type:complete